VITVSDRSARGEREDRTGPRLAEAVRAAGHEVFTGPWCPTTRTASPRCSRRSPTER